MEKEGEYTKVKQRDIFFLMVIGAIAVFVGVFMVIFLSLGHMGYVVTGAGLATFWVGECIAVLMKPIKRRYKNEKRRGK